MYVSTQGCRGAAAVLRTLAPEGAGAPLQYNACEYTRVPSRPCNTTHVSTQVCRRAGAVLRTSVLKDLGAPFP